MDDDSHLAFKLPGAAHKKLSVSFDGGMVSSRARVLLVRGLESQLGMASRLADGLNDRRDPDRIDDTVEEMLHLRMFAIAVGYEHAKDCNRLRDDRAFQMSVGRVPKCGATLNSRLTLS